MDDELKQHVRDGNAWTRLLFTGGRNARVLSLGASLSAYAYQIFRYLTYNSELRPFPFTDWPADRALVEEGEQWPAKKAGSRQRRPARTAAKSGASTAEAGDNEPDR
jgi:Domain of unknown function (DUF4389)